MRDGRPPRFWFALLLAAPAAVLVDSCQALARGWGGAETLSELTVLAVSEVTFLVVTLALFNDRARGALERRRPELLLLLGTLTGCFVLGEFSVRVFRPAMAHRDEYFHLRGPQVRWVFRPAPGVVPGVGPVARFTTNAEGVRGRALEPRGQALRLLCVGGSTTECVLLDDRKTWPALVEAELAARGLPRPWVGNAGFSGYATAHHLVFLEGRQLRGEVDCVILMVGLNDLVRALAGEPPWEPRPVPLWCRVGLFNVLQAAAHPLWTRSDALVEDLTGENYTRRRRQRAEAPRRESLPELQAELDGYGARLRRLARLLRAEGVNVLFVTQAALWRPDLPDRLAELLWMGWTVDGSYLTVRSLREGLDRFNERLLAVARELEADPAVGLLDLAPLSGRGDLFYDDCHFTESGAREVADRVGAFLAGWVARGLLVQYPGRQQPIQSPGPTAR